MGTESRPPLIIKRAAGRPMRCGRPGSDVMMADRGAGPAQLLTAWPAAYLPRARARCIALHTRKGLAGAGTGWLELAGWLWKGGGGGVSIFDVEQGRRALQLASKLSLLARQSSPSVQPVSRPVGRTQRRKLTDGAPEHSS